MVLNVIIADTLYIVLYIGNILLEMKNEDK